jgi:hypothetical protein
MDDCTLHSRGSQLLITSKFCCRWTLLPKQQTLFILRFSYVDSSITYYHALLTFLTVTMTHDNVIVSMHVTYYPLCTYNPRASRQSHCSPCCKAPLPTIARNKSRLDDQDCQKLSPFCRLPWQSNTESTELFRLQLRDHISADVAAEIGQQYL